MFAQRGNKSYWEFDFQFSKLFLGLIDNAFPQLMTMGNLFVVQVLSQEHAQVTELQTANETDGLKGPVSGPFLTVKQKYTWLSAVTKRMRYLRNISGEKAGNVRSLLSPTRSDQICLEFWSQITSHFQPNSLEIFWSELLRINRTD